MVEDWRPFLAAHVRKRPILILRLSADEWTSVADKKWGLSAFSIARAHQVFADIRRDSFILCFPATTDAASAHLGVVRFKAAVSTLESRISLSSVLPIVPRGAFDIASLIEDKKAQFELQMRLMETSAVSLLTPTLSLEMIETLAKLPENEVPLREIAKLLGYRRYSDASALQSDAIDTALRIFGFQGIGEKRISLIGASDTTLAHVHLLEDAVIEHDARNVPGMKLIESSMTGYAEFEANGDRLRVYTANKRPLEELFGVDLIYFNKKRGNMVLIQYKMLEPTMQYGERDWIFRPTKQFAKEVARMEKFGNVQETETGYRLSREAFYMKFVKRDTPTSQSSVIMPIEHLRALKQSINRGPRGGFLISYNSLNGHYLREGGLIDLIRSGYIGSAAPTTEAFESLISEIVDGGNAIVAAIQERTSG